MSKALSREKKVVLTLLMLTIPVVFFLAVEGGLRLFNYGGDLDLFILDETPQSAEYVLNPNFTKRYFFKKGIKTPLPITQRFSASKDSLTYRIFCLGASTTQGFPYTPNAAFPAQLQNILATLHPDRTIEVINCGITAISSHSVLDMSREILEKYQPDLLVVYSGNNEFYGVFGQASRLALFDNQTLIQGFLKMQRSRLFLLLRDILIGLFGERVTRESVADPKTLMGTVVREAHIPFNSPLYQKTETLYKENLIEIIAEARGHQTDILLCNLIANVGALRPFSSIHVDSSAVGLSSRQIALKQKADSLLEHHQYREAVSLYNEVLQGDNANAEIHYRLGSTYRALGMHNLAHNHYYLARDFDTIRFRAPSSFNRIIREVAEAHKVPLVDLEKAFRGVSPDGIIGSELILEHVHPNHKGYLLMAQTIAETMSINGLIRENWDWRNHQPDSLYLAMCHLTPLDHEVASYGTFRLTSHWPFTTGNAKKAYQRIGDEETEEMAKMLLDKQQSNLIQLHLDLGEAYIERGETARGLAEYKAALAIEPHCDIYNYIGPVYTRATELAYRESKDYDAAARYYQEGLRYFHEGLQRCPDHLQLNFNLGLLYALRADQTVNALSCFQKVLRLDPGHQKAMRMVAKLHIQREEYEAAERNLLQAVNLFPEELEFHISLGYVYAMQGDYKQAESWLKKALHLKPQHDKTEHLLRQVQAKLKELQE